MIIKIHDSVFTHEITEEQLIPWQRFLSCIVRTAEYGYHFILISPEMISHIAKSELILEHQKNVFRRIIRRSLYNFDELGADCSLTFTLLEVNTANHVHIFQTQATEIDRLLQPTEIILEDIDDDIVYKQILQSYIEHINITAHYYYHPLNGGGNGSFRLVPIHYMRNRNIHAIFDTDKKYPTDNLGETARKLIEAFGNLGLNDNYHVLDCNEVENLHPIQSFREKSKDTQLTTVLFLEHAIQINQDTYKFFDFKKSHKFCEIFNFENNLTQFWRDVYLTCNIPGLDLNSFINDVSKHQHTLTPQLSTVARHLKDDLAKGKCKHTKINDINPPFLQDAWKGIGQKMLKWTIAAPQIIL